jgi:beta-glucosidase
MQKTDILTSKGSATSIPRIDQIAGMVQGWYLGNEAGNAIADIIYGTSKPSSKLPITFPAREQDIAAYQKFGRQNGIVDYCEDTFVGYKHFDIRAIAPLFSFGRVSSIHSEVLCV